MKWTCGGVNEDARTGRWNAAVICACIPLYFYKIIQTRDTAGQGHRHHRGLGGGGVRLARNANWLVVGAARSNTSRWEWKLQKCHKWKVFFWSGGIVEREELCRDKEGLKYCRWHEWGVFMLNIHTVQVESVLLVMQRNRKSLFFFNVNGRSQCKHWVWSIIWIICSQPSFLQWQSPDLMKLSGWGFSVTWFLFSFLILSLKCVVKLMETC